MFSSKSTSFSGLFHGPLTLQHTATHCNTLQHTATPNAIIICFVRDQRHSQVSFIGFFSCMSFIHICVSGDTFEGPQMCPEGPQMCHSYMCLG